MSVGYYSARKNLFPRGVSHIAINLSLPPLIFSSIVPAFTKNNVSAIWPTFLIALIYAILGLFFGLIIREVCYVPRNLWQGIVVACCFGNWGNLRTVHVFVAMFLSGTPTSITQLIVSALYASDGDLDTLSGIVQFKPLSASDGDVAYAFLIAQCEKMMPS
ncbi:hypothetical protein BJ322DRAFT_1108306 [Thelephora terrestris]|uniref:Uncharacterized protein n=1 Tax=Thelephora terrestris TaxID=56493 RepID=A0A9P6L7W8_9AGAM|nr:hypothetical protein BJ322DRAFT_1108306 [Thelephora terrestris]